QIREEQKQTKVEKRKAEEALEREQHTLYYQRIALAAQARANNHASRAEELLDQCPLPLRGWEWHYLKRLPFAGFPTLPPTAAIASLAFSPDGRLLASGTLDGVVEVGQARTGEPLRTLPRQDQVMHGLAFSPDGQLLATGGEDRQDLIGVRIWNLHT